MLSFTKVLRTAFVILDWLDQPGKNVAKTGAALKSTSAFRAF